MQTLLHSQRVNCTFWNTIQNSSLLRQRLWLEPGFGAYFLDEHLIGFEQYPRVNPLLGASQVLDIAMFCVDIRCISHGGLPNGAMSPFSRAGPVVAMSCRGILSDEQPESASWREMLVVSNHEPHFQFQIWREDPATTKLATRGPVMYLQSSPKMQQVMSYTDVPYGVFMVPTEGRPHIPADFAEVQDVLQSWRQRTTDNDLHDLRFTLLSQDMTVDHSANQATTGYRDRYSTSIIQSLSAIHSQSFDESYRI